MSKILMGIKIEIPDGASINGIYREDTGVLIQLWATPDAADQIFKSFNIQEDDERETYYRLKRKYETIHYSDTEDMGS